MSNNSSTSLWSQRFHSIGHTGWKNPVLYEYDQIERLALIKSVIETLNIRERSAIDFGCGTGDFSRVLLDQGFRVWGYDPYVSPQFENSAFHALSHHQQMDGIAESIGLILSVTVLDHILDDSAFLAELTCFNRRISNDGVLLLLEYALDEKKHDDQTKDYQAFRTQEQWKTHLDNANWLLEKVVPVPHPTNAPSTGFTHYRSSVQVRLLIPLLRFYWMRGMIIRALRRYAHSVFARYGAGQVTQSPLKLMICRPKTTERTSNKVNFNAN